MAEGRSAHLPLLAAAIVGSLHTIARMLALAKSLKRKDLVNGAHTNADHDVRPEGISSSGIFGCSLACGKAGSKGWSDSQRVRRLSDLVSCVVRELDLVNR